MSTPPVPREPQSEPERPGDSWRRASRWLRKRDTAQVSTMIALAGLIAGLWWNARQITEQTRQANEGRVAADVTLLTTLNQAFAQVNADLALTHVAQWHCDPDHGQRSLSRREEATLFSALNYYDYLAWLINHGRIAYDPGRTYMRAEMLQAMRYGEWFFAWEEISASFPELSLYRYRNVDDWEVCPADSGG
jgi:hypothetical protein